MEPRLPFRWQRPWNRLRVLAQNGDANHQLDPGANLPGQGFFLDPRSNKSDWEVDFVTEKRLKAKERFHLFPFMVPFLWGRLDQWNLVPA